MPSTTSSSVSRDFRLFDSDHALVADLLHRLGEEVADFAIAVGGDSADLCDLFIRRDLLGVLLKVRHDSFDRKVDTALEIHRVHARGHRLRAFPYDRRGQNGRGGGAVAGGVGGARSDLTHHLRTHVLELVFQLDLLRDRHTVLGDARSAEGFVEHDVAAFRTERHLHRVREDVDTAQHTVAGIDGKSNVFSSHCFVSFRFRFSP